MLFLEQAGGVLCLAEEFCMQMGVTLFSSEYVDFLSQFLVKGIGYALLRKLNKCILFR